MGLVCAILALTSCSKHAYYQICSISSDLQTSSTGAYAYQDNSCEITYNFWSNNGHINFIITNNTEEIMCIDLSKSFLIKNGIAYDYYLNRTISSSSSMGTSSIASSSASVSGTVLGYWTNYIIKSPGTFSATATNSVSATASTSKAVSISFEEKSIISIPPKSSKAFYEYDIMNKRFTDCDLYESPSNKEFPSMSFSLNTTPVSFTNYICYRIGENGNDVTVKNDFYVSKVVNQNYNSTIETVSQGCKSDFNYNQKVEIFINSSPQDFYIIYNPRNN